MSVIQAEQLTKTYRRKTALDDVSFSIPEHTITGLIGRNGAGKTTLLKTAAGFIRPSAGSLHVDGEPSFDNLQVSANSIFIDESMNWPAALSLGELLQEGKRFYENWDETLPETLFDYFGLNKKDIHKKLSKGKKSTFNMIFGLAARCPVTLLDEPMTGMDAAVRSDMFRVMLKEYIAHPRTIILSSHHVEEVEELLEDVILIDEGRIQLHVSMDDMREKLIGLTGEQTLLTQWTKRHQVLHSASAAAGEEYVIVENDFSEAERREMSQNGITLSTVPPVQAAVYLTAKKERSIDDVLERR
ncbi:ATP-binding cassette domain-containing protein [Salibacterium qingdaonense]|uniref:ABC-2 type transport system ATP-binding protein n=1 Tax=Salibacterium qingdaonense TaxID=266892 RepID=A0A1I4LN88_9BACI|nr:ABC transporter ATP-binding protein [Salibacterium qingdaonense]SFL92306.1 ABC-2 type transport system ATP-binding protein [Salibacterium qingdaonense]